MLIRGFRMQNCGLGLRISYLAIFETVLGFVWYLEAIKNIGPTRAALFINFVPIFSILLAFFILREPITLSLLIGAILVTSGVYLVNRETETISIGRGKGRKKAFWWAWWK
jgi:drug/metabolite transporter (DMT)-like permease